MDRWIAIQVFETGRLNARRMEKTPDKIHGLLGERVTEDHFFQDHAIPAARICRMVVPSPCSSSSAAKRPANVRINASIGPVTSIPVPADQFASEAFALMPLNNVGPGKNRSVQRSSATGTIRPLGILRRRSSGRRMSIWWMTMSASIEEDDRPGRCAREKTILRKS